jgi:hypothetical protein
VPSAFITYSSPAYEQSSRPQRLPFLSRRLVKTIRRPSGDQAASSPLATIRRGVPPSAGTE